MVSEYQFYTNQGINNGYSVQDKRYLFYKGVKADGRSVSEYMRDYYLTLLGDNLLTASKSLNDAMTQWMLSKGATSLSNGLQQLWDGVISFVLPQVMGVLETASGGGSSATITLTYPTGILHDEQLLAISAFQTQGTDTLNNIFWSHGIDPVGGDDVNTRYCQWNARPSPNTDGYVAANSSFNRNVGARRSGMILRLRDCDISNVLTGTWGTGAATSTTVVAPSITVPTDNSLALLIARGEATAGVDLNLASTPAGWTLVKTVISEVGTGTSRTGLHVFSKAMPTAGVIAAPTVTFLGAASNPSAYMIALPPAKAVWTVSKVLAKLPFFAHRGGSSDYPEMSMKAYDECVKEGIIGLEVSLSRSSDGVWFGHHDQYLDRVALGTGTTTLDYTTMTWAQIQAYGINFGQPGGQTAPFMRAIDLFTKYPNNIYMVDPKYGYPTYTTEFLNMIDTYLGPTKAIIKYFGTATALATAAHARGYLLWGYYYETDYAGGVVASNQANWDILGMEHIAAQATWTSMLAFGKQVLAHIPASATQYNSVVIKGAQGGMVSKIIGI